LCIQNWIGYQAIALIYLLSIVLLALFISRGPIFFGTVLTAAGWNFFFAPPAFAFNISDTYDNMMLLTYFVVTLTVGQLTTRLRMQREAEMNAKLLVESERLGRTLLNSVSHELRTPIAIINSAANSLHSTGTLPPNQTNLVTEIELASARLNRVVQNLLSAARIQSGQVLPKPDWCDISDLIRVALRGTKSQTCTHPVKTFIPSSLPLMKADFVLTEQALANLIVNAATHTPPATPIEITARVEQDNFILEVADLGSGLPPDQLERIFDPFYRTTSATPGGTGLGLAIVKGFIEAQGGGVKAANRKNGGAVFTISMPIADAPNLPKENV
jgi:two-component system sensor histidine kinase KdpD